MLKSSWWRQMRVRIVLLVLFAVGMAEGKAEKAAPPTPSTATVTTQPPKTMPRRNFIDLRHIPFACGDSACSVDIAGLNVIACDTEGCRSLTDIIVSTGPVLRLPNK